MDRNELIRQIRESLRAEQQEQESEWLSKNEDGFKLMRSKGQLIYPLQITKTRYGFAEYPIVSWRFSFELSSNFFKPGVPIAFFSVDDADHVINGVLISLNGQEGEVLLHTSGFPDWMEDETCGVKLVPDTRTFQQMHGVMKYIEQEEAPLLTKIFEAVYGFRDHTFLTEEKKVRSNFSDDGLNEAQQEAVRTILSCPMISIVHGPPGTGKTTTLVAAVQQLVKQGKKVVVTVPSNAAIDHFAKRLIQKDIKVLRTGNISRIDEALFSYTLEGVLQESKEQKQLKKLRKRADEFRKMAHQYKRNYGKEEREQRKRLKAEVRAIQFELKKLSNYVVDKAIDEAEVVLATPIGLTDEVFSHKKWDVLLMDEAGQCNAPLGWLAMKKAEHFVFAGDPYQLPPTVFSDEAKKRGLDRSILELFFDQGLDNHLLDIQYRMPPELIAFSSDYFYEGKLKSAQMSNREALVFYDTAGADYKERNEEGAISNDAEIEVMNRIINKENMNTEHVVFISPYAEQVAKAKAHFKGVKCSTIDSFQGQEADTVLVSLVRSNDEGKIGFLKEYRRMNVLLTRAKSRLIIVGDSATLGNDAFYQSFLSYVDKYGVYHSVFELIDFE